MLNSFCFILKHTNEDFVTPVNEYVISTYICRVKWSFLVIFKWLRCSWTCSLLNYAFNCSQIVHFVNRLCCKAEKANNFSNCFILNKTSGSISVALIIDNYSYIWYINIWKVHFPYFVEVHAWKCGVVSHFLLVQCIPFIFRQAGQ